MLSERPHLTREYFQDDALARGAWYGSLGIVDRAVIVEKTRCPPRIAFRISLLRQGGSPRVIAFWLTGLLTLRQLERIVLANANDDEKQLRDACLVRTIRAVVEREGKEAG